MSKSEDSLGIQNSRGRPSGASETLALPTNLFKKLRDLDRKITELDKIISSRTYGNIIFKNNVLIQKQIIYYNHFLVGKTELLKLINRRINLDLKRKDVRNKRKHAK
jgi:hypothetical protein